MIYTVTFNPSIDYIVRLEQFTPGEINRVNYEQILPGGKGINVSIVLTRRHSASSRDSQVRRCSSSFARSA